MPIQRQILYSIFVLMFVNCVVSDLCVLITVFIFMYIYMHILCYIYQCLRVHLYNQVI